jgi:hypothetical protein
MAVFLHQIVQAARITGRGDEGIAHGKDGFGNVATEAAGAAGYQPDFRHESSIPVIRRTGCKLRLNFIRTPGTICWLVFCLKLGAR